VVALITMAAFSAAPPTIAQDDDLKPVIHLPQMRHDFGKSFEKEKYEHDFVIMNRGKADLIIEKVKPG
jgi:hypothetical protein